MPDRDLPANKHASTLAKRLAGFGEIRLSQKSVPLAIAVTLLLAFGLLLGGLGFYQDDWVHVYFAHTLGLQSLWELFLYSGRPVAGLLYMGGFRLLGFKPFGWHVTDLLLRFLTVFFIWLALRQLWPANRRQAAWAALLFAVYPVFKIQPMAVSYAEHWVAYLLFAISLWAMLKSLSSPRGFWLFLVLALVTSMLQMAIIEYFLGLELVRPLVIWLVVSLPGSSSRKRLFSTLKLWLPYLLLLAAYMVYRFFLLPRPTPDFVANAPTMLYGLFNSPLTSSLKLAQTVLQDTFYMLVTAWLNVLNPAIFAITQPANLKVLLLSLFSGSVLLFYLTHLEGAEGSDSGWHRPALALGLALTLLGPVPGWLIGRSISEETLQWSSRFGLAAMVGTSLVIVALLELLIRERRYRTILFAALIAFSISWHLLYTNDYRWSWVKQTRFYEQLSWRAPFIEKNTAFLSDGEIFSFMGEYPTAYAIGSIYPKDDRSLQIAYWFYSVPAHFGDNPESLVSGRPLDTGRSFGVFHGNSRDSLVVHFLPEENKCLWVLRPEDVKIRDMPEILQVVGGASNLERIQPSASAGDTFDVDIFGKADPHTWCYYYEKADLARQLKDWPRIFQLWNAAQQDGFRPQNGVEYLPFIEGLARTGAWAEAQALSLQAGKITGAMDKILCPTWESLAEDTPASPLKDSAVTQMLDKYRCSGS